MARKSRTKLPKFRKPPVTEVALSVQFAPLTLLQAIHFGPIYETLGKGFPKVQDLPPLGRIVEAFGDKSWRAEGPALRFEAVPTMPRLWFLNEDGSQLIQIQRDRFAHNWRKVHEKTKYPSFGKIFPAFERDLQKLNPLLKKLGVGGLKPDTVEVIFINIVGANDFLDAHASASKIFAPWSQRFSDSYLLGGSTIRPLESLSLSCQHVLTDGGNDPIGRLRIDAKPSYDKKTKKEAISLNLSARIILDKPTVKASLEKIKLGHDIIVQAFASFTTAKMHEIWGRR